MILNSVTSKVHPGTAVELLLDGLHSCLFSDKGFDLLFPSDGNNFIDFMDDLGKVSITALIDVCDSNNPYPWGRT